MTHETMLNLGTFALAIPGAVANTTDQIQKIKKKLAKKRGRLQKPTFSDSHPVWSGLLSLSMVVALACGFWMVLHPSVAHSTVATVTTSQPTPPRSVSPARDPANPISQPPKSRGGPLVQLKPVIPASTPTAPQAPPQVSISGGVRQGGDGGCQQNIIVGNGNTQNCVLPPFSVSNEQAGIIAAHLKAANLQDQREVIVDYEYSAVGGGRTAKTLVAAFNEGGVKATLGAGAGTIVACDHEFMPPGLSVDCVTPSDQSFLEVLGDALAAANLASVQNPIPGHRAPLGSTLPLTFVIRKR
jgi:hypothetical protein